MKCPECGEEMVRKTKGPDTFTEEGWLCVNCKAVQKEIVPQQLHRGVVVKGFRKAWWESQMTPEEWQKKWLEGEEHASSPQKPR